MTATITSNLQVKDLPETKTAAFMKQQPTHRCWKVVLDYRTMQLLSEIVPSTAVPSFREQFPAVYIGGTVPGCDGLDGAIAWVKSINNELSLHANGLIRLSHYNLERWLNYHFQAFGLWSSRLKPLEAMEEGAAKQRRSAGDGGRRKPKARRRDAVSDTVADAEVSSTAARYLDESRSHHQLVSGPAQVVRDPVSRGLENNVVSQAIVGMQPFSLQYDLDACIRAAEDSANSADSELSEIPSDTEEDNDVIFTSEVRHRAAVSASPTVLQSMFPIGASPTVLQSMFPIGEGTPEQVMSLARWCASEHKVKIIAITQVSGLQLAKRPNVSSSVAKSISAKFSWIKRGGQMTAAANQASKTQINRLLIPGNPALMVSFHWKPDNDKSKEDWNWGVRLSKTADGQDSFLYKRNTSHGSMNDPKGWGDAMKMIVHPTIAPDFKQALNDSIAKLAQMSIEADIQAEARLEREVIKPPEITEVVTAPTLDKLADEVKEVKAAAAAAIPPEAVKAATESIRAAIADDGGTDGGTDGGEDDDYCDDITTPSSYDTVELHDFPDGHQYFEHMAATFEYSGFKYVVVQVVEKGDTIILVGCISDNSPWDAMPWIDADYIAGHDIFTTEFQGLVMEAFDLMTSLEEPEEAVETLEVTE